MPNIRSAKLRDIPQIKEIESEYYEGFASPESTLQNWIDNLSEHFLVYEDGGEIIAFIFFEYLTEIKATPFIHELAHVPAGKYAYITEVGIRDKYVNSDILQTLLDKLIEKSKSDERKSIIWLTGSKRKHDKIESDIISHNGFIKHQVIMHWEAYPGHYVDDHILFVKEI